MSEALPVFFCMSEDIVIYRGNAYGDMPEPDEWGRVVEIVVARNRSQARYLAWKNHRRFEPTFQDWPAFTVRKLGTTDGPARVLEGPEAEQWYERVPEGA